MPAVSKTKLYDVCVNPFNGHLGSLCEEVIPSYKWMEHGSFPFSSKGRLSDPTASTGWVSVLQGTMVRNGAVNGVVDPAYGSQLRVHRFTGSSDSSERFGPLTNENSMMINAGDYRSNGNPMRITALGCWIRYIGNVEWGMGKLTVRVGSLHDGGNETADYDTYAEMKVFGSVLGRKGYGTYTYTTDDFKDGKKKYFASVPLNLTLAKIMAPAWYGEGDYSGNNQPGSAGPAPEWMPIVIVATDMTPNGKQCWEIGYYMKCEGITDQNDSLRFFETTKGGDVDGDSEFEKVENEEQVFNFFRKYIKNGI